MMKLSFGDKIRHRRRDQYGIFVSNVLGDNDTVLVRFDGENHEEKVSRDQLAKVMG